MAEPFNIDRFMEGSSKGEHAKRRLAASRLTQEVVTRALKLAWTPVGEGMSPREETVSAREAVIAAE